MGTTRKVLRQVAATVEGTPRSYEAPAIRIPFTSFTINSEFDMIADESIEGVAQQDLPNQGVKRVEGQLAGIVDVLTMAPILEAAFGAVDTGAYSLPTTENTKTLSICGIDGVKTYKYAGAAIKGIRFSSETNGRLTYEADVVAYTETRDDTAFPTITTEKGTRLVHHHASGTGYMRIANQDDALAAGDNQGLSRVEFGFEWGFESEHDNTGATTLVPLSRRNPATFSFQISRHTVDTWHAARDAATKLQAELYYYVSATASLKFQIANFILSEVKVSEDDVAKVDCVAAVGRNGIATTYTNASMAWVTPIKATLDNS